MAADKLDGLRPADFGKSGGGDGTGYVPLRRPKPQGEAEPDAASGDAGAAPDAIAVSVAGIPAEQLTPEVDRAIEALMAETGRLREEIKRLRRRVGDLELRADRHPALAMLSRPAFMAQLGHVLGHVDQLPTIPALVVISVVNAETVRLDHGLGARDALLAWLAAEVRKTLHASDTLGSLGGADFGVIALFAGDQAALGHADALRRAIADEPFRWGEASVAVDVACGAAVLRSGLTTEDALRRADEDLKRTRPERPRGP